MLLHVPFPSIKGKAKTELKSLNSINNSNLKVNSTNFRRDIFKEYKPKDVICRTGCRRLLKIIFKCRILFMKIYWIMKTRMLISKSIKCDLLTPFLYKPSHVSLVPMWYAHFIKELKPINKCFDGTWSMEISTNCLVLLTVPNTYYNGLL